MLLSRGVLYIRSNKASIASPSNGLVMLLRCWQMRVYTWRIQMLGYIIYNNDWGTSMWDLSHWSWERGGPKDFQVLNNWWRTQQAIIRASFWCISVYSLKSIWSWTYFLWKWNDIRIVRLLMLGRRGYDI